MGRFALLIVSASLLMRLEFFFGGGVVWVVDWIGWDGISTWWIWIHMRMSEGC